jgi:alpha-ketoglutaric semialdehyde dehydrogenase
MIFEDSSFKDIDHAVVASAKAFEKFRKTSLAERHQLLSTIAGCLKESSACLIAAAMRETNLPEGRLQNEIGRTIFQLESYGAACEEGVWLDASLDLFPGSNPPKPNIRKTMIPLGPVVVFGSSNFPFAYSTAGGDTASALAAGCTVIVKAHPAHPETSSLAAEAIASALLKCGLDAAIFQHVYGASFSVGEALVKHPLVKAVGFTGSFSGGKQLFDWASQRKEPIPVFAEMGSVNPVFLFPEKLHSDSASIATQIAASFTLGVGQFCTKPGLIIGIAGDALQSFIHDLGKSVLAIQPATMLHHGIANNFITKREAALLEEEVHLVAESLQAPLDGQGQPTVATIDATTWLSNPLLHQEIFGPFTLVISCKDHAQLLELAKSLEGQLTITVFGTTQELVASPQLLDLLQNRCGRFIINGVPTGVEVCKSMQHGGPFPATTDVRYGAVGADAIKRFARPLSFQNCPDELLPLELQDANPLKIPRTINGKLVP